MFENFLNNLQINEIEYILILQSILTQKTVLLQRCPADIWINPFAKQVPQLWYANIDTQFILDAYIATSYCSSYMTKQDQIFSLAF